MVSSTCPTTAGLIRRLPHVSAEAQPCLFPSDAEWWKENEQISEAEAVLAAPQFLGGEAVCQPSGRKDVYL